MKLLAFFRKESNFPLQRIGGAALVSGTASLFVLVLVNVGVQHALDDTDGLRHLMMFLLAVGIYILAQRHLVIAATTEVEEILHRVRLRIGNKIRNCGLEPLDKVGRSQIYMSLSRGTQTIAHGTTSVARGLQSGVLLVGVILYLFWLSMVVFVAFLSVCMLAVAALLYQNARRQRNLAKALEHENKMLDALSHVLDGFTEIKMNPRRGDDLYLHLRGISDSAATLRIDAQEGFAKLYTLGQLMFFLLIGTMIYVVPIFSDASGEDDVIVQSATVILFLMGPLLSLIGLWPTITNTHAAIIDLEDLETKLDNAADRPSRSLEAQLHPFNEIRLENLLFQFHHSKAEHPFTLGPVHLKLRHGETVFITGGNGSGKSTFLRLLTGLYEPDRGAIHIDAKSVSCDDLQAYRNLFSVIFSDFHLFHRLYGLQDVKKERVTALLDEMGLGHKTQYRNGEFSTLELSTGQRKRLAYIVSLLEDRPIYIFDEWAAGQDFEFRHRFYESLLPELKERGKTIIAVTHDDRYWSFADRVLKMSEGRFVDP